MDDIFTAFAHPVRRAMMSRLTNKACTVGELAEPFNLSMAAISKHLKLLERAGLVVKEKQRTAILCRLNTTHLQEAIKTMSALSSTPRVQPRPVITAPSVAAPVMRTVSGFSDI